MSNDDECEQAYRAGWRAAGAAIAERIAEHSEAASETDYGTYVDALWRAEQIARDEVRGE